MDYKRIYIIYKRWSENRIIVQPKEIVAKESTGAVYKQWIEEQVIFAFVLSIVIHGSIYLSYGELKKLDWKGQDKIMQMLFPSSKLQIKFNPSKHLNNKLAFLQKLLDKVTPPPQNKKTLTEPPLLFVSVPPPTQAAPEPPKNTQFYSEKNSIAANPEIEKD
ncbi:MAG TPA: hypothetical protein PLW02_08560, partial [Verrucomicrobiota bacterium]|nr:hypothetical protein [Verrucomicrobiota bacterium]